MVTRVVSNSSELSTALSASVAGDVIEGTAGANLGALSYSATNFTGGGLTIRSQSQSNRAYFTSLNLSGNAGNITFEDILFNYTFTSGDSASHNEFYVNSVVSIRFRRCEFNGDTDGAPYNYATGQGLNISYGSGHRLEDCKVKTWADALFIFNTTDFQMTGTEVTGNSADGCKLTSCTDVLIQGCHFHNNAAEAYNWHDQANAAHVDCIQLQRNLGGCSNVQILDNVFDYGQGTWGQCIWAGADGYDMSPGSQYRHSNITIRGNIFYNGHVNGYGISGADGLTIEKNTMLEGTTPNTSSTQTHDANGNWAWQGVSQSPYPKFALGTDCTNVTITDNISAGYHFALDPSWTATNNYVITRADYGNEVTVLANGVTHTYHDYELATGAAHTGLAGSRMMKRTGGWSGQEITPPSTYQGGVSGVTPLPVLPAGSVAATVTVP